MPNKRSDDRPEYTQGGLEGGELTGYHVLDRSDKRTYEVGGRFPGTSIYTVDIKPGLRTEEWLLAPSRERYRDGDAALEASGLDRAPELEVRHQPAESRGQGELPL